MLSFGRLLLRYHLPTAVQVLCQAGADVDKATPLFIAAQFGHCKDLAIHKCVKIDLGVWGPIGCACMEHFIDVAILIVHMYCYPHRQWQWLRSTFHVPQSAFVFRIRS